MRELWPIVWHRFTIISGVVADAQARTVASLFYFTILVPFGLISLLFTDPMRRRRSEQPQWLEREPVPTDLDSAREQG